MSKSDPFWQNINLDVRHEFYNSNYLKLLKIVSVYICCSLKAYYYVVINVLPILTLKFPEAKTRFREAWRVPTSRPLLHSGSTVNFYSQEKKTAVVEKRKH